MRWKECAAEAADGKPYTHMGVIDAHPVQHTGGASLGKQGDPHAHSTSQARGVEERRKLEWMYYSNLWAQHLREDSSDPDSPLYHVTFS